MDSRDPCLEVVRDSEQLTLKFTNPTSLSEYTADLVGQRLAAITLDKSNQVVLFDLSNVDYITSTLLGHLVLLHKRLKTNGGSLQVQNMKPAVAAIFRITQLDHVLDLR